MNREKGNVGYEKAYAFAVENIKIIRGNGVLEPLQNTIASYYFYILRPNAERSRVN